MSQKICVPEICENKLSRKKGTLICLITGGGLIIVLALKNHKNNRTKTKNYITELHYRRSQKKPQEVDPPSFIRNKRVIERPFIRARGLDLTEYGRHN